MSPRIEDWMDETIDIGTFRGFPVVLPASVLFFGGITKSDLRDMIYKAPTPAMKQSIINSREHAGDILTELNISTNMATQLLINKGEMAYAQGNRSPWAVYAHKKLNQRLRNGCLIPIVVFVVILWLIFR